MFVEALSDVANGTGFETVFQTINDAGLSNPTTAIALSLGVAGAVYLAQSHFQGQKNLPPMVPYTNPIKGSTEEYNADPSGWVKKQKAKYGPVFRANLNGRIVTIVGKDMVRDVALRPDMSFLRAISDNIDIGEMIVGEDSWKYNEILHKTITKHLTPNLRHITGTVVTHLDTLINEQFGDLKEPLILDDPTYKFLNVISKASARVFVGEELCENKELLESFKNLTMDTAQLLNGNPWFKYFPTLNKYWAKLQYMIAAPVSKHWNILENAVTPIVERRV
ncbi:hypothetical protein K7432_013973 [Basidiobolus ranarum]|uniref:Uncharacterized protein n=1 Tax=Basidiobolus ranarum TaxID=34480 RepID=A0ABR2VQ42_9FUNG